MTETVRWVIGRGLLGRAIERSRTDMPLSRSIPWGNEAGSIAALREGLSELVGRDGRLEVYWSAGRAVTSSPAAQFAGELRVFEAFVAELSALPADARDRLTVFLASSVGGAYAGSPGAPFTEESPVAPLSEYGRAKLEMEDLIRSATRDGGWRTFIARITNLYGPGQDLGKGQGLISVLISGLVTGAPVSVYVPLDTLRDYIYEDDCAAVVEAAMRRMATQSPGETVVKIVGAMRAVSIGALLSELTRVRRRRGRVVLGRKDATGQSLDLRVRSTVWTDLDAAARTTLPDGLSRIFQAQLSRHALRT